jgi:hypothetical protein
MATGPHHPEWTSPVWPALALACLFFAFGACQNGKSPEPTPDAELAAGPPLFRDMTPQSGVHFTYRNGQEANHCAILEAVGGGVALLDYDGDGLLDIFVTGGGQFTGPMKQTIRGRPCKLYKNLGNWKFKDVTADVGLDKIAFYTHGCAVADYDCDGWPDLLVTGWGRLALYRNVPDGKGGRRFVEVTAKVGLHDRQWSTSAAWGDLDGDGFPDLYVCHYVDWSFRHHPHCTAYAPGVDRDVCPPVQFGGLPHMLYRNNGGSSFTDVSARAGLRRAGLRDGDGRPVEVGKGLGVAIADLNDDGRPDIYVANDTVDNFLYVNRGGCRFEEMGLESGVARDDRGQANGSMGVAVGDFDRSGRPSIFVTNYENENHALYRNLGAGSFLFCSHEAGIAALGRRYVGFGTAFVDVDGDGWEDLVIANGHVVRYPRGADLRQRPVLLRNRGGRFEDITAQGGPYFRRPHLGRGLAVGDLDNDGRPDLVISHLNEPVVLLRNVAGEDGQHAHWLGVELAARQHRDTVGARLTLEVGGRKLTRFAVGGGSYLSSGDPRHLFGLGSATRVRRLSVRWPSGTVQHWEGRALPVDRYWRLVEGQPAPERG